MIKTTELCERLKALADGCPLSPDLTDALESLARSSDERDCERQLELVADMYMQRGLRREFLEVTKVLRASRGADDRVQRMHRLACMLNNMQSST